MRFDGRNEGKSLRYFSRTYPKDVDALRRMATKAAGINADVIQVIPNGISVNEIPYPGEGVAAVFRASCAYDTPKGSSLLTVSVYFWSI